MLGSGSFLNLWNGNGNKPKWYCFELEVSTIWLFALHMATIQIHGLVILNPYLIDLPQFNKALHIHASCFVYSCN